jgi:chromosome segregation ATPase
MRYRTCFSLVILTTAIPGIIVLVAGTAVGLNQAQRQKQLQQQKKEAAANADKATAAAKTAQDKADAAKKVLTGLNLDIKAAQQAVDDATRVRKTLEDEIIDAQSADSDVGKARDQFRAADKKYQAARKSVLESDDYKAKLEAARNSDDPAARLALQKEFDAIPEIAEARSKVQEVKETYEPLRTRLFEADSKWVDANKDVKDKKATLDDLNHQFAEANVAANKAKAAARKAAAAATAAAENAAAAENTSQSPKQLPKRNRG